MKNIAKKILSIISTLICKRTVKHGEKIKCNFPCHFTKQTVVGNNCLFNGIKITGKGKVTIGDNFRCARNVKILTSFHNYDKGNSLPYDNTIYSKDVYIEDNVWIGIDVIILGGVRIGEGAVIQAGSVVCKDIPPLAIAGGHPATAFKYRDKSHYYSIKESTN